MRVFSETRSKKTAEKGPENLLKFTLKLTWTSSQTPLNFLKKNTKTYSKTYLKGKESERRWK